MKFQPLQKYIDNNVIKKGFALPYGINNTPELEALAASAQILPNQQQQETYNDTIQFKDLQVKVKKLADLWKGEIDATEARRRLRYMEININENRQSGKFKADEIYIPIHVINDNITKESAQYIAYLTTSRNSAIFKPKIFTQIPMANIENWFTKLVRYPGWEIPFFRVLDGAATHAWDSVEVVFDADKPGHFGIKHLKHENCWFSRDTESLQQQSCIVVNCKCSKAELEKFPEINLEQLDNVFKDKEHIQQETSLMNIQKVFYKEKDGLVYVCWMNYEKCTDFLRGPKPLWLGRKSMVIDSISGQVVQTPNIYESQFPIEPLLYLMSEDSRIMSSKGRCMLDEYIQEAASSLVSSIVNSWHRASIIMGAPKTPVLGGAIEQTKTPIEGGRWYNQPVDFFHMPYPDAGGMTLVQALLTQNKSETSQVNFAVNNREDSRKTAREISAASQQSTLLSGAQVTLFSMFLRNVFTRCWSIAQSQAQQGLLNQNDLSPEYLNLEYELYSAGDIEVVQREETLQKLQASWPVIANTPAALPVLKDILTLAFPSQADKYVSALEQSGQDSTKISQALALILDTIIKSHSDVIPPEDQQKVQQLLQLVSQMQNSQQGTQNVQQTNNNTVKAQPQ